MVFDRNGPLLILEKCGGFVQFKNQDVGRLAPSMKFYFYIFHKLYFKKLILYNS